MDVTLDRMISCICETAFFWVFFLTYHCYQNPRWEKKKKKGDPWQCARSDLPEACETSKQNLALRMTKSYQFTALQCVFLFGE